MEDRKWGDAGGPVPECSQRALKHVKVRPVSESDFFSVPDGFLTTAGPVGLKAFMDLLLYWMDIYNLVVLCHGLMERDCWKDFKEL